MSGEQHKGWSPVRCGGCGGHGMVSAYSAGDFDGAKECEDCGGTGTIFESPGGRLAQYPGGPFRGSVAKEVATA